MHFSSDGINEDAYTWEYLGSIFPSSPAYRLVALAAEERYILFDEKYL